MTGRQSISVIGAGAPSANGRNVHPLWTIWGTMIKEFEIRYTDPETGQEAVVVMEFEDTPKISAEEWAKDYAYMIADKGPHTVRELK
jgi:hypothetical protein